MKKFFAIFLLFPFLAYSQTFFDNFEDADINDWTESNAGHWSASNDSPIDGNYSLHHIYDASASENDKISHPISGNITNGNTVWQFQVKYTYNPSSTNNWTFFLMADADASQMQPSGNINGYAIGVNFTGYDDTLYLLKISNGSASIVVNTHLNWQTDIGTSPAGIMVTRTASGDWKVYVDTDGGFDNLVQYGNTVNDVSFTTANYLGVFYEFTASYDQRLWIDDVSFTPPSNNDNTSTISEGSFSEPSQILSTVNSADGVPVFDFTFTDAGSGDGVPTIIKSLTITSGDNNNIADWTQSIAGAKLFGNDFPEGINGNISENTIVFSADTLISIEDGANETYTLNIWLKTDLSEINDNDNFEFKIDYNNIITDYNGSSFGSGSVESGDNNLSVAIIATKAEFTNVPISVLPSSNFQLGIKATDANGNIDLDANNNVSLTISYGEGNLSSASGLQKNLTAGEILWNDLQYDQLGYFKISAQIQGLDTIETPLIEANQYLYFLNDDFEDGNLFGWFESSSSHWQASTNNPINGNYSLRQVYDASDYGTDIIYHQLPEIDWNTDTLIWEFQVRYENGSPSSTNNWYVFLAADNDYTQMNPSGNINGFVVGVNFGTSDDLIKLWHISDGNITTVISTSFDWNNTDENLPKGFRIIRTSSGEWEIKIDEDGGFDNLFSFGTGTNTETFDFDYYGIVYNYSSTQDQKLTLDDIYIGEPVPDLIPPELDTVYAISPNSLRLLFNEDISNSTAQNTANYSVNNGIGNPQTATQNTTNKRLIELNFINNFVEDTTYQISISGIKDIAGNETDTIVKEFVWQNIKLENVILISPTEIDIKFSKIPDTTSALTVANYNINNEIGNPVSIIIDSQDSSLIHLSFANQMQYETNYILHIENIADKFGNLIAPTDYEFTFYIVRKYDIVINELMIDVNPQPVALPPYKYIELFNTTEYKVNLNGWTLQIGTNRELNFNNIEIQPYGYIIICPEEAADDFAPFGTVAPILVSSYLTSTSGKRIIIKNSKGEVIEDLTYTPDWYNDPDKDDGGWSLERIDPTNICNQNNNWHATENYAGGTPGMQNTVYGNNPDILPPSISEFNVLTSQDIDILFSETPDTLQSENIINYILNNDHTPITAITDPQNPDLVHLHFIEPHITGDNYLSVKNISDYCANVMNDTSVYFFYQPLKATDAEPKSSTQLKIYFSEPVDKITAENPLNYTVNNGIGNPVVAVRDANDSSIVHLFFNNEFPQDTETTITIESITDLYGNPMNTIYLNFTYHIPQPFDIVINELMLDINPQPAGLPANQYIEFFNTKNFDIWLTDWTFLAENQRERTFPTVKIPAYGYLLMTTEDGYDNIKQFGTTVNILGTNDLTQEGKELLLYDNKGNLIYHLRYSKQWYNDEIKEDGGWSLEKKDPYNFCESGYNWKASEDISGGTPGRSNSVFANNPDTTIQELDKFDILASNQILLVFKKNISFNSAFDTTNYFVSAEIGYPYLCEMTDTSYKSLIIYFKKQFADKGNYTLTVKNVEDDCGNAMKNTTVDFTYYRIHPEYVWTLNANQIQVKFSETADYITAINPDNYYIDNNIGNPNYIVRSTENPSIVFLQFDNPFQDGQTYTLHIENIKDINGNTMTPTDLSFIYYKAKINDLVINEILFNPYPGGADYVELYNRCPYPVNLKDLRIAKRDDDGEITSVYNISQTNNMFEPGTFLVITTDSTNVKSTYPFNGGKFIQLNNMPAYPDDEGTVVILNDNDSIIDQFHYNEDFHFALISDPEGVALERINPDLPTQDSTNWHSAAKNVNYGTPGIKNSQFRDTTITNGIVSVSPEVFSPDNDGFDDQLYINFQLDQPGYMANVMIFNKNGQLIRYLQRNAILEQKGFWIWDGLDDNNQKVKTGIYVIVVQIFNTEGKKQTYKIACVVAGMR